MPTPTKILAEMFNSGGHHLTPWKKWIFQYSAVSNAYSNVSESKPPLLELPAYSWRIWARSPDTTIMRTIKCRACSYTYTALNWNTEIMEKHIQQRNCAVILGLVYRKLTSQGICAYCGNNNCNFSAWGIPLHIACENMWPYIMVPSKIFMDTLECSVKNYQNLMV